MRSPSFAGAVILAVMFAATVASAQQPGTPEQRSDASSRIAELERQLQEAIAERDKLRAELADLSIAELHMTPAHIVSFVGLPSLHAWAKSIGIYNRTSKSLEFKVTDAGGAVRAYDLGAFEIVTVPCGECRSELAVSVETPGEATFSAHFDGGSMIVPVSDNGRWELAVLGNGG